MITREHNAFYKRTFDAYVSLTGDPEYSAYKATEALDEFIEVQRDIQVMAEIELQHEEKNYVAIR